MGFERLGDARLGVALVRVVMGVMLIYSGYLKVIAMGDAVGFFGMVGLPAPQILAPIITAGELLGGALLLVGLGVRYVAVWFIAMFLVTTFYVKLPGFGYDASRIDIMLLTGSGMLLLSGAGAFALDGWRARRRSGVAEVQAQVARA
jgi:putative oxidoreductase